MDPRQKTIEAALAKRSPEIRDAAEAYAGAIENDADDVELITLHNRLRLALRAYEAGRTNG